ncbi:hypothetical protein [Bacillus toyonensis]|uniref:hypothetical protein n=1 Tax=Bacillus toyonensis TaxID=155322 RepID=UPI002E1B0A94|nr:hypothetical protein [Bacillus toyonensis]
MDKRVKIFSIGHLLANGIIAVMCFLLIYQNKVIKDDLVFCLLVLWVCGLSISIVSKKSIPEYFISFLLLIPIVLPISYAAYIGQIPTSLIFFDALGVWYIHIRLRENESSSAESERIE